MKFLAALVHAAAAALPIQWDFNNPAQGDEGVYIANEKWAVAFRTPASGTTICLGETAPKKMKDATPPPNLIPDAGVRNATAQFSSAM
ncbi:hypothetical protein H257_11723 [Aphanomyces astaci]|uniref:Uncharacterized protein n=1 Tax=Aphanomyces astaci TaxID=112090 RepID=W4G1P9_APHAT|nr:hypothetical protein H257_11723 [Aphanomyces astaci]ETV73605.1 hypothetical protein H257_11723 [Aphanomyces astaci]|eukprot:XP_009837031.1 hypothetical protein H257_11723 [Aphanomyces astaci]